MSARPFLVALSGCLVLVFSIEGPNRTNDVIADILKLRRSHQYRDAPPAGPAPGRNQQCNGDGVVVLDVIFSHPDLQFNMRGHNFGDHDGEYYWMCHDKKFSSITHYTSRLLLEVATDFSKYYQCTNDGEPGNCLGGNGYVGLINLAHGDSFIGCDWNKPYWGSLGTAEECLNGATPQLGQGTCKWRVVELLKTVEHHDCLYSQQNINDKCAASCTGSSTCDGSILIDALNKCPDVGGGMKPQRGQPMKWEHGNSNKCVDVPGGKFYDGAQVWIWTCLGLQEQEFFLTFNLKGQCQVVSAFVPQYCLTMNSDGYMVMYLCGEGGDWGTQTWDCDGWKQTGKLAFDSDKTKCLTVAGGEDKDGASLFLWTCSTDDPNQNWNLGVDMVLENHNASQNSFLVV